VCDRQTVENKEIKKTMRGEIEGQVHRGIKGRRERYYKERQ
jgi:hypothetical protein